MKKAMTLLILIISVNIFSIKISDVISYSVVSKATDSINVEGKTVDNIIDDGSNSGFIEVTFAISDNLHQTYQENQINFTVQEIDGLLLSDIIYPVGLKDEYDQINFYNSFTLKRAFNIIKKLEGESLAITANWQLCNDAGSCLFPESLEFSIPITSINNFFIEPSNPDKKPANFLMIFKYLLFALFGGFILNFMPCVFPVLSIKAMSLVNQSGSNKREIRLNSFMYTLGVIVSFIILALVIIIIKISGESVGWGFQFQSPFFVIILLSLIFLFALSLFDVFLIRAPGMQLATKASTKEGSSGAFFSGVFAVLLATPCTAPLLGAALGFAFSQPPLLILIIFISIGLGLAFPFILFGIFPKMIKIIPRPGNWMIIFKEFMGFLLLLTALYLLRSLFYLVGGANLIRILLYLVILGFAAWLYGTFVKPHYSNRKQWIFTILALLIIIAGANYTLKFSQSEATTTLDDGSYKRKGWQRFSPELVDQYRNEGKSVFLRFSAEWCLTCKTNETTVLFTHNIEELFAAHNVELLLGDYTKKDEQITEWLQKFNRAGVPLYLYFPVGKEPVILPEVITKDTIYKLFR